MSNGSQRSGGIEVEGLVREFKNGPRAVDGIDLQVAQGEIYGFLGPNGAGKSTTVLMLTTLLPPTAGTARVAGYDVVEEGPRVRASIGAALQCDNSNVTGIVDSLEEKGLAQRRPSEEDRRVKLIELTAEGRRVQRRLSKAFATPPDWVEGLAEEDRRMLRDILRRAVDARTPGP